MEVKKRIFIRKVMTGVDCHAGKRARMFVLTESNEAIANGYSFRLKFQHLMAFLRKKTGLIDYCCVMHRQGDKKRINCHVIYFGDWIDKQVIEDWWWQNYGSHTSKMEEIKFPAKHAYYLCKYLDGGEKFVNARFSRNWVFPSWWEFGKWIKKEFGEYPNTEMISKYSKMTQTQLEDDPWYYQYLLGKVKAGKLKAIGNGRRKKTLIERVLKSNEYKILSSERI